MSENSLHQEVLWNGLNESDQNRDAFEWAQKKVALAETKLGHVPQQSITFAGGSGSSGEKGYFPYVAWFIVSKGGACTNIDMGSSWEVITSPHYRHIQRNLAHDFISPDFNPEVYGQTIGHASKSVDFVECSGLIDKNIYGQLMSPYLRKDLVQEQQQFSDLFQQNLHPQELVDIMRKNLVLFAKWVLKAEGVFVFNRDLYVKQKKNPTDHFIDDVL